MKMKPMSWGAAGRWCAVAVWALLIGMVGGCAGTHEGRSVKETGFLGDYSMLKKGTGDEALFTYVNPQANFRKYNKIIMEPIKVYPGVGDSFFRQISPAELQKLVDYFDATVRDKLSENYTFVSTPGPDVMLFRAALTEADSANVPLDVVSSVVPIGLAVNALKTVATGRGTGIGETSVEFDMRDSMSGERLGAAVDKRVGDKFTGKFDKFNEWRATQSAFDYWAERVKVRLAELRNKQP